MSYKIVGEPDGTGTLEIEDPELFRLMAQALTSNEVGAPNLVEAPPNLPHPFFSRLIDEINAAYSKLLYTSTYVCLRKLFENLLIELLRARYGTTRVDLYYWADRRRFHDFSVLIENLEDNIGDFAEYTREFNAQFFTFIRSFAEQSNRTAHSIDIIEDPDALEKTKDLINQYCLLLCIVISRL